MKPFRNWSRDYQFFYTHDLSCFKLLFAALKYNAQKEYINVTLFLPAWSWRCFKNELIYYSIFSCLQNYVAAAAMSLQSCPTLCNPIDGSSPGSTVPGILQARTHWSGLSFPSPMHESESEVMSNSSKPHGLSLPGSSVHGIFQARVLEWVALAFSDILDIPIHSF